LFSFADVFSIDEHAWKTYSTVLAFCLLIVIGFGRTTEAARVGKTERAPEGWIANEADEDILATGSIERGEMGVLVRTVIK
jgi:hypothetical protein